MTEHAKERVPRPEEVLDDQAELTPELRSAALRCRAGSSTQAPCPRQATTFLDADSGYPYPLCDEHARVQELVGKSRYWDTAVVVSEDWLRLARAWEHHGLEQMAAWAHEKAKAEFLKAEVRVDLATDIADAPRKGDERPNLTREQDEELRRLMMRSDALTNAYTTIEGMPEGRIREDVRRRMLGVLVGEHELAEEEASRYKEELGFKK